MTNATDEGICRVVLLVRNNEEAHLPRHARTKIWHKCLRHCSSGILTPSLELVCRISEKDVRGHEKIHCDTSALGNLGRSSVKTATLEDQSVAKPLDRVCADPLGPIGNLSLGNPRYFVTLLHFYSRFFLDKFLHRKSELGEAGIEMGHKVENIFNLRTKRFTTISQNILKWVSSNAGGEFESSNFHKWLKTRRMVLEVTTACSSESNGRAGGLNQNLLDMTQAMTLGTKGCRFEL